MRTTIELSNDQRAELLRLAARRGLKGFSRLVQEAVDNYIRQQAGGQERIEAALGLRGALKGKSGQEFEQRVRAVRDTWR